MSRPPEKAGFWALWIFCAVLGFAFWGVVIWVAAHFAAKYW